MTLPPGFSRQYGIRLPDGEMFKSPYSGSTVTWSDIAAVEPVFEQLREQAQFMGMTWTGTIVHRYCTSFVDDGDDAEHLVAELEAWLKKEP